MRLLKASAVVLGIAVVATTAHAQTMTLRQRVILEAVRTVNALLAPWSGTQLRVAFPSRGPDHLFIDVVPFDGLVQTVEATAAEVPGAAAPAAADIVVAPDRAVLAMRVHPPEPDGPDPLDLLAGPGGALNAHFIPPVDPSDDVPLTVRTTAAGEIDGDFQDPSDASALPAVSATTTVAGDIHLIVIPPVDPSFTPEVEVSVTGDRRVTVSLGGGGPGSPPVGPGGLPAVVVDTAVVGLLHITDSAGNPLVLVPAGR